MNKVKCFEAYEKNKVLCEQNECRQWINSDKHYNCTIVVANNVPPGKKMKLEDIGDIMGLSKMRICQIEKNAESKFKKRWKNLYGSEIGLD